MNKQTFCKVSWLVTYCQPLNKLWNTKYFKTRNFRSKLFLISLFDINQNILLFNCFLFLWLFLLFNFLFFILFLLLILNACIRVILWHFCWCNLHQEFLTFWCLLAIFTKLKWKRANYINIKILGQYWTFFGWSTSTSFLSAGSFYLAC